MKTRKVAPRKTRRKPAAGDSPARPAATKPAVNDYRAWRDELLE